jgi:hypothetical protein
VPQQVDEAEITFLLCGFEVLGWNFGLKEFLRDVNQCAQSNAGVRHSITSRVLLSVSLT